MKYPLIQTKRSDYAYLYLVFYMFWGFIFTRTVFANNALVYVSFLFLLFAFGLRFIKYGTKGDNVLWLCVPFFAITSVGFLLRMDFEHMTYWLVAMIIILTGASNQITERIKFRLFYYFGVFALIGVLLQLLFPAFYQTYISSLFVTDDFESWAENYGFVGFTYQLATTAEILVCAECAVLCLWDDVSFTRRKWTKIVVVVLLIIGIFMTGKRMNSIVAIIIPFFVNFFSRKTFGRRFIWLLLFFVFVVIMFNYINQNLIGLSESAVFRRTVVSIETIDDYGALTSGRDVLWGKAIEIFKENPIFGVGVGRFRTTSGESTAVHNMYLQCLCEQGLVGLLFLLTTIIVCFRETIKQIKKNTNEQSGKILMFSLAIQISYILEGITENMNVNLEGFLLYSIAVALMLDCKHRVRNPRTEQLLVSK